MRIVARNLVAGYGRRAALDGVSIEIAPGSVFALLGRNGAGKSTFVKLLLGQRPRRSGLLEIDGLDPWRSRVPLMARIGATPEVPDAPVDLRVGEIERFLSLLYSYWDRTTFGTRLDRFGISPNSRFGDLSRGQKSLVHLGLALAHRPTLLVLDDPTLGLDVVARRFVFDELISELAERSTTVFLTSHDLEGVERVATHAAILVDGKIARSGELEALRTTAFAEGLEAPTLEEIFVRETAGEGTGDGR